MSVILLGEVKGVGKVGGMIEEEGEKIGKVEREIGGLEGMMGGKWRKGEELGRVKEEWKGLEDGMEERMKEGEGREWGVWEEEGREKGG